MLPELVKQKIEENKSAMLDTLQTLIGIPSVATAAPKNGTPYGTNCAKALDFMLQTAESFGLHTTNFDYHVGVADTSTDTAPYLGILAHLDVVPVMEENWHTPPFTATIQNDCIYGRGAIDDKGPAVAALYAIKAIADAGIQLKKPVRLLLGCNEENGSTDLEYYNQKATMPPLVFTPDGSYPLISIEKGMMRVQFEAPATKDSILLLKAGTAPNAVPAQAVCVLPALYHKLLPENC
ncbi:MAG: Sapep family Mn(2+)-dependent dipeptidase, partial [Ruminococcus sp.]|nr:Sapep family Mn(2+)-dependent dipeptidase [Ruminococcus sp.]